MRISTVTQEFVGGIGSESVLQALIATEEIKRHYETDEAYTNLIKFLGELRRFGLHDLNSFARNEYKQETAREFFREFFEYSSDSTAKELFSAANHEYKNLCKQKRRLCSSRKILHKVARIVFAS